MSRQIIISVAHTTRPGDGLDGEHEWSLAASQECLHTLTTAALINEAGDLRTDRKRVIVAKRKPLACVEIHLNNNQRDDISGSQAFFDPHVDTALSLAAACCAAAIDAEFPGPHDGDHRGPMPCPSAWTGYRELNMVTKSLIESVGLPDLPMPAVVAEPLFASHAESAAIIADLSSALRYGRCLGLRLAEWRGAMARKQSPMYP